MTWASSPFQISAYPENSLTFPKETEKMPVSRSICTCIQDKGRSARQDGENLKQVDPELLTHEYVASERVLLP